MTDRDLVDKLLALIETCVQELRTLARPELIATDVRERRFVEHTSTCWPSSRPCAADCEGPLLNRGSSL